MRKLLLTLTLTGSLGLSAHAEDIAITNGELHTMSDQGIIEGGTLLISGDKITAIGTDIPVPEGYRVIDAQGKPVTPGLFDGISSIGLSEVTLSAGIEDDEAADTRLKIAPDASYAFNPENTFVPSTRIAGVTRSAASMKVTNSFFAGQGALVHFGLGPDHIVRPRAFLFADLQEKGANKAGGSRAALWVELGAAIKEADSLTPSGQTWAGGQDGPLYNRIDLEALRPALQGRIPLIVRVNKTADIRQVLALKAARPEMKLVIFEGTEAWRVADELAAAEIPVILHPLDNLPEDFNRIGTSIENATRLHAAGVTIAFTSWGRNERHLSARLLAGFAGNAVAHGVDRETALAAITRVPAEIYGVAAEVGTLSVGKDADVVVWSGDPLEVMEAPTTVLIRGDDIPLVSRQTLLRDRYRTLP